MPLQTTVVGSRPKPAYLNIPDWFSEKGNFPEDVLSGLTGMGGGFDPRNAARSGADEELEKSIKRAVCEVIKTQVRPSMSCDALPDVWVVRLISGWTW